MRSSRVTVVVPTLASDPRLLSCLEALERQTFQDFETVVVDNSGTGAIHRLGAGRFAFRLIENQKNVGFGAAANQGFRYSATPYVAVLNDDAAAAPQWLESLLEAADGNPKVGMVASRIVLSENGTLDSAGLLVARDGSSKQRGHGENPNDYAAAGETLLPSGCAALYRRSMLDEVGMFDEEFFLYCEDTDLGLRGRLAGWGCAYAPSALVEHHYSASAGKASALKAYFVERNRLRLAIKLFPVSQLAALPMASAARYFWHVVSLFSGRGRAGEFRSAGGNALQLPWYVLKAHAAALIALPRLWKQRAAVKRKLSSREFGGLLRRYRLPLREVASQ